MAERSSMLLDCMENIMSFSERIEGFLDGSEQMKENLIDSTKRISDFSQIWHAKRQEKADMKNELEKGEGLHVKNFDSEQIWQGIEMNNESLVDLLASTVDSFSISKINLLINFSSTQNNVNTKTLGSQSTTTARPSNIIMPDCSNAQTNDADNGELDCLVNEDDEDLNKIETDADISSQENNTIPSKSIENAKTVTISKKKSNKVDDDFFVLEDMNRFLDLEDKKEMRKDEHESDGSEEDIDYFGEDLSGDESEDEFEKAVKSATHVAGRSGDKVKKEATAQELMYSDFFDSPMADNEQVQTTSKNDFLFEENEGEMEYQEVNEDEEAADEIESTHSDIGDDDGDNDEEESTDSHSEEETVNDLKKNKDSRLEKETKQIKERIKSLEKENIAKKPWQLIGETNAAKRPKNSLLEEHLTFDQTLVGAPTITEETTVTLEDTIRQRIKDQAWDDVIRKVKPVEKPFEYKKSLSLDQEKSKLSLAEVYEKEYVKQTQEVKEEETNPDHEIIQTMMDRLFLKLDALSNFQYTPKQPKPELKIITNLPSLQIEEATPVTVSTEAMLAPEEIYDKKKGGILGQDEKTSTDKKRERREKKAKKRAIIKNKEIKMKAKANQGIISKDSKKDALEKVKRNSKNAKMADESDELKKTLKSSSAFFTQLQETVEQQVHGKKKKTAKRKEKVEKSQQLKL